MPKEECGKKDSFLPVGRKKATKSFTDDQSIYHPTTHANVGVGGFFKQKTAYEMTDCDGVQTCALPIYVEAYLKRFF